MRPQITKFSTALLNRLTMISALILMAITLNGCGKALSMNMADKGPVPSNIAKLFAREFQQRFSAGEWRYQNVQNANGLLQVHIQIPDKLDLDDDKAQAYIRAVICPDKRKTELWSQIGQYDLAVNLYTSLKSTGINETCVNPLT